MDFEGHRNTGTVRDHARRKVLRRTGRGHSRAERVTISARARLFARALHLDKEIGSIEKGKRADLVIVDLDDLNQTPWYNIYSDLVYATKADDVRTVIIEGRVVMRDRRLLTLNEEAIKADARKYRERIVQSVGIKTLPEE